MSRWFRHYAGMMRDDKLVRVSIKSRQTIERVLWVWGAILESAAEIDDNGRYDLDAAEIAYFLRADEADISAVLAALADAGRVADGAVVKWGNRQFSSDRSAARVAEHRERKRAENRGCNSGQEGCSGDVTLQERHCNSPETEADTETDITPLTPQGGEQRDYAFAGKVIRLNKRDLGQWSKTYHAIPDITAELSSLDAWFLKYPAKQKDWFHTTAGALNRKHQEALAARRAAGPVQAVVGI